MATFINIRPPKKEGQDHLENFFRASGHRILRRPLAKIMYHAPLKEIEADYVIVSSYHALSRLTKCQVAVNRFFSVGPTLANELREKGALSVAWALTAEALVHHIINQEAPSNKGLFYSAKEVSLDFTQHPMLRLYNIKRQVCYEAFYDTCQFIEILKTLQSLSTQGSSTVYVPLLSTKMAAFWRDCWCAEGFDIQCKPIYLCLSQSIHQEISSLPAKATYIANQPTMTALLSIARKALLTYT